MKIIGIGSGVYIGGGGGPVLKHLWVEIGKVFWSRSKIEKFTDRRTTKTNIKSEKLT